MSVILNVRFFKKALNYLYELLTLPLTMLFSAPFTLPKYLDTSCHLDLSRLPLDYEAFLFFSMNDHGFFNNLRNTMLLCNRSHDLVFLMQVLPCCSLHHTRNGTCYQRTLLREKPKGTLSAPSIFTNPHHKGRGFSVTFVDTDDIRGNHKRPHFLHLALGPRELHQKASNKQLAEDDHSTEK